MTHKLYKAASQKAKQPETKTADRDRKTVKSMAELSRLMQAAAMPAGKKNNSWGR